MFIITTLSMFCGELESIFAVFNTLHKVYGQNATTAPSVVHAIFIVQVPASMSLADYCLFSDVSYIYVIHSLFPKMCA